MTDADPDPSASDIPRILHSVERGAPFQQCIDCGGPLLESGIPYGVEKVMRQGEVIFEYAICASCTMKLMREFSQESLQRLMDYFQKSREAPDPDELALLLQAIGGDPAAREQLLEQAPSPDHCHRCGRKDGSFEDEHTVMGLLVGPRLVTSVSTICAGCTEGMDDILSRKTRESHDDFVQQHFPGVPADLDIPAGILGL